MKYPGAENCRCEDFLFVVHSLELNFFLNYKLKDRIKKAVMIRNIVYHKNVCSFYQRNAVFLENVRALNQLDNIVAHSRYSKPPPFCVSNKLKNEVEQSLLRLKCLDLFLDQVIFPKPFLCLRLHGLKVWSWI